MQQIAFAISVLALAACIAFASWNGGKLPQEEIWQFPILSIVVILIVVLVKWSGLRLLNTDADRALQYQYALLMMVTLSVLFAALEWAVAQSQKTLMIVFIAGIISILANVVVYYVRRRAATETIVSKP